MPRKVPFDKVEACGNDFVLLQEQPEPSWPKVLCDRYHGIGADGVMVLRSIGEDTVVLDHFDPDGSRSFCLNGIRASLGCLGQKGTVPETGSVRSEGMVVPYTLNGNARVTLKKTGYRTMDWEERAHRVSGFALDVGNPQFVILETLSEELFEALAPRIRNDLIRFPGGTNVNMVWQSNETWRIKTFERGVETFTKACGSGMLASALVLFGETGQTTLRFKPDGQGSVTVTDKGEHLIMEGATRWVASGEWLCGC